MTVQRIHNYAYGQHRPLPETLEVFEKRLGIPVSAWDSWEPRRGKREYVPRKKRRVRR